MGNREKLNQMLYKESLYLRQKFGWRFLETAMLNAHPDQDGYCITITINATIAAQKLGIHTISYPSSWWDAVKERFAPAWFIHQWPIKRTIHQYDTKALYPRIALPDEEHWIATTHTVDGPLNTDETFEL